jgi:hypothetical protein
MTGTSERPQVGTQQPVPSPRTPQEPGATSDLPRVLTNLHHGDHVAGEDVSTVTPKPDLGDAVEWAKVKKTSTPFGYMFDDLRGQYPGAHLPTEPSAAVVACLKALGTAMVEQPDDPATADSTIPPIYTYWGQFVDHDLTANTDRNDDISITDLPLEPLQPEKVERDLRNLRDPRLNLDSVYGNGPEFSGQPDQVPYDGDRLRIGSTTDQVPPGHELLHGQDLPRLAKKAQIGDGRNDENLVIAQIQLSFLKFHNAVLDWFQQNPDSHVTGEGGFERARRLVQLHYQWITVHDFLKRIAQADVVDGLLDGTITPRFALTKDTPAGEVFMPLEFSIAAYRFGHSMVRGAYDWNVNFGFPAGRSASASFQLLFTFTGNAPNPFFGADVLPDNWPAQFERFTGFEAQPATDKPVPARFARKIDTHISPPLADLSNEGNSETSDRIKRILKRLAVRNLLRGYRLGLPTGQAVARSLGITPLRPDELLTFPSPGQRPKSPTTVDDALVDGGFLTATPLWFYVLREAEVIGQGERLGPVGSRIVAETIIGQLRADPRSFINQNWDPSQGVTTGPASTDVVDTIITFLRFAGMHP